MQKYIAVRTRSVSHSRNIMHLGHSQDRAGEWTHLRLSDRLSNVYALTHCGVISIATHNRYRAAQCSPIIRQVDHNGWEYTIARSHPSAEAHAFQ